MDGYYNVYLDGELVASGKNNITEDGRKVLLRFLAGHTGAIAGAIAIGNSQILPARTDTKLFFEFGRGVVDLAAPDFMEGRVIYKAPIPNAVAGMVYELGLYPYLQEPAGEYASRLITGFEPSLEPFTGGTANTTNFRLGNESLQINVNANGSTTVTMTSSRDDFGGYGDDDTFSLSYFINDANTSSIRIRARNDASNYYEYSFVPTTSVGYFVSEFGKGEFVATGLPDWTRIVDWTFTVNAKATGASVVQLDGLRINDRTEYIDYALVSRAVLANPIIKTPGQQMDVEYVLETNI